MGDIVIRAENLSKRYKIGALRHQHDTLRDQLAGSLKTLFSRNGHSPRREHEIWALKDVSLEIRQGEVVGIVGRNGAGKSTLLKILSRITVPTEGRARIRGRLGSLLEVGTGFHWELTGRENIYLNGAILGMKRTEIDRKFDAIVAFAEVEKFIDTPVKRYSSGMYVRLAFAVAAHLEFDTLLVDEVLAVGDVAFQEKCLGTMEKSASNGKTIIYVSHNMSSIQSLCKRAILLQAGQISTQGSSQEVVRAYLMDGRKSSNVSTRDWQDRITNGQGRIVSFEIADANGHVTAGIPMGGSIRFSISADVYEPLVDPCFGVFVHDAAGRAILDLRSVHGGLRLGRVKGNVVVHAAVDHLALYPGEYFLSPWISDATHSMVVDCVRLCSRLHVDPVPGPHGDLRLEPRYGTYWVRSNWSLP